MSKSMILNMQNLYAFLFKTTRWSLWCFQDHPMMDFGKILLAGAWVVAARFQESMQMSKGKEKAILVIGQSST